jgi:hypothetical protein
MFQFSGSCFHNLCIQLRMIQYYSYQVSPFGHLRVITPTGSPELFAGSTSFFACRCQGILQQLLIAWPKILVNTLSSYNNFFALTKFSSVFLIEWHLYVLYQHLACWYYLPFDYLHKLKNKSGSGTFTGTGTKRIWRSCIYLAITRLSKS